MFKRILGLLLVAVGAQAQPLSGPYATPPNAGGATNGIQQLNGHGTNTALTTPTITGGTISTANLSTSTNYNTTNLVGWSASGQLYYDQTNGAPTNPGTNQWLPLQSFDVTSPVAAGQALNLNPCTYTYAFHHPNSSYSNTVIIATGSTLLLNQQNQCQKFEGTNEIDGGHFVDTHTSGVTECFVWYLANDVPSMTTFKNVVSFGKIDNVVYNYTAGGTGTNAHNTDVQDGSFDGFWDLWVNGNTTGTNYNMFTNTSKFSGTKFHILADAVTYPGITNGGASCYHAYGINNNVWFSGCTFDIQGNATNGGAYAINLDGQDLSNHSYSVTGYVSGCAFSLTNTFNGASNGVALRARLVNGAILYVNGPAWPTNTYTNDATSKIFFDGGDLISSLVASNAAVSVTANVVTNITSIVLPQGDWDVEGNVNFFSGSATVTGAAACVSSVSGTMNNDGTEVLSGISTVGAIYANSITLPRREFNVSSSTTVYLEGLCKSSVGTLTGYGGITARRIK